MEASWLNIAVRSTTWLGGTVAKAVSIVALGIILWMTGRRQYVVGCVLIALLELSALGVKELIGRPRPDFAIFPPAAGTAAFPSGHAIHAFLFFGFLFYLCHDSRAAVKTQVRSPGAYCIVGAGDRLVEGLSGSPLAERRLGRFPLRSRIPMGGCAHGQRPLAPAPFHILTQGRFQQAVMMALTIFVQEGMMCRGGANGPPNSNGHLYAAHRPPGSRWKTAPFASIIVPKCLRLQF